MIQDEDGSWVTNPVLLKQMVTKFYKTLFAETLDYFLMGVIGLFPAQDNSTLASLGNSVSCHKVHKIIRSTRAFKASDHRKYENIQSIEPRWIPGYQWEIVGEVL